LTLPLTYDPVTKIAGMNWSAGLARLIGEW
jgi:hypothetical protein